jgi:hypothetical protein
VPGSRRVETAPGHCNKRPRGAVLHGWQRPAGELADFARSSALHALVLSRRATLSISSTTRACTCSIDIRVGTEWSSGSRNHRWAYRSTLDQTHRHQLAQARGIITRQATQQQRGQVAAAVGHIMLNRGQGRIAELGRL